MKRGTIKQNINENIDVQELKNDMIIFIQYGDIIQVEKSKLPDLIKILQSFVES